MVNMTKHWMMQATDDLEFQNVAFSTVRNVFAVLDNVYVNIVVSVPNSSTSSRGQFTWCF